MGLPLLPLIGTASGLLGSLFGSSSQSKDVKRTISAEKEMADYKWNKDLEMWNLQNAYNSPEAQMRRFKDAGLNPNLIYGQGSGGNASALPSYSQVRPDYTRRKGSAMSEMLKSFSMSNVYSQFQDIRMKDAQIDNVRALKDLNEQKVLTESINRGLKESQTKLSDLKVHGEPYVNAMKQANARIRYNMSLYAEEMSRYQAQALRSEVRNKSARAGITESELEWLNTMKATGVLSKFIPLLQYLK